MTALDTLRMRYLGRGAVLFLLLLACPPVWPQAIPQTAAPKGVAPVAPEPPKDPLGRDTPRKTILGFLNAARKDSAEVAALYLNTPLRGEASATLAHQLAVVLNDRLPARLNEVSDKPEGSLVNLLNPDEDVIGTISTSKGDLDIVVERVDRGSNGRVWLFSRKTLAEIPVVFQEVSVPAVETILPKFLVVTRVAEIPLFEWLALFVGMPLLYVLTGLPNRIINLGVVALRRCGVQSYDGRKRQFLRPPIRLLLLSLTIRWLLTRVGLPLFARQFWSSTALMITIVAGIWLLMLLTSWGERYFVSRHKGLSGSASVWRLAHRLGDGLLIVIGLLFMLHYWGVNVSAALAGLGVGGIAVALAAQKTLENVIAGISLIADQALRVGDVINVGDVTGTVEEVGLRSTRIRTLDRTLASLPNGQIANMRLEILSARDKFWFHPVIGLRYETTSGRLNSVLTSIRRLLSEHPRVDATSIRARLLRFGTYGFDVDIFAYVFVRDTNDFFEVQETLIFEIMAIIDKAGVAIAFPSQIQYLTGETSDKATQPIRSTQTMRP
jgi:MscS family membrane protein